MTTYLYCMAALAVIAVVMSIPDLALLFLYLTFGLGVPLVLAASGLAYGACLFPLVLFWRLGGLPRLAGGAISAAAIAVFALLPGLWAQRQAERAVAEVAAADRGPAAAITARSLEIRRKPPDYDDLFADREACGFECRSLLLTGKMDWVRVVMNDGGTAMGRPAKETRSFYLAGGGADCAVPGSVLAEDATCVLLRPDPGTPAGLVVIFEEGGREALPGALDSGWYRWQGWRRAQAFQREGAELVEQLRRTDAELEIVMRPTVYGPELKDMSSSGTGLIMISRRFNPISFSGVLAELGLAPAEVPGARPSSFRSGHWKDGINDEMTRELISVLDLPGEETFGEVQNKVIRRWVMHARSIERWTPELITLLRRIVRERRFRRSPFVEQIVTGNTEVAREILPDVFDMIEIDGLGRDATVAREVASILPRLDSDLLKPHAGRILALMSLNDGTREHLLPVVGRLGIDPTRYLLPFTGDLTSRRPFPRVRGACFAEKTWAPVLIPELRAALKTRRKAGARSTFRYAEELLEALANLGDGAFVEAELVSGDYQRPQLIRSSIEKAAKPGRLENSLCYP